MSTSKIYPKFWFVYAIPEIEEKLHIISLSNSTWIYQHTIEEFEVKKLESIKWQMKDYVVLLYSATYKTNITDGFIRLKSDRGEIYWTKKLLFKNTKYNFIYNVSFNENKYHNPPEKYNLSFHEQYTYFMQLRSESKEDKDLKHDLVSDTIIYLDKIKQISIDLFLSLFRESYLQDIVIDLISTFNPEIYSPDLKIHTYFYDSIIKQMRKSDSLIRKKFDKFKENKNKKKNLNMKFEYFILYYYCHCSPDYFIPYIVQHTNRNFLISIMFENKKKFQVLNNAQLMRIYKLLNTKEEIDKLLNFAKDITALLNFIFPNWEMIKKWYNNQNILELDSIAITKPTDNLLMITKLFDNYLSNKGKYPYLKLPLKYLTNYLYQEERTMEDYLRLKQFFEKHKIDNDNCILKCNEQIKKKGLNLLNENKMGNSDIIKYITNVKELDPSDLNLFGNKINLDVIDDKFIDLFKKSDFNKGKLLPQNNYKEFLNGLIRSINSFQHLANFLKLYEQFDMTFVDQIQDKYIEIIKKEKANQQVIKDVLIQIIIQYQYYSLEIQSKQLIQQLKLYLNDHITKSLFIDIIVQLNGFSIILEPIIPEVMPSICQEPAEKVFTFISNIGDKNTLKKLFDQLKDYEIKEEDLIGKEENRNIILYRLLTEFKDLNINDYINTNYFRYCNDNIQKIKEKLKKMEFTFSQSLEFLAINKEVLRKRMILLLNKEGETIFDDMYKIFEFAKDKKEMIDTVLCYYKYFYLSQKSNIQLIENRREEFITRPMKEIMNNFETRYNIIIENYKKASRLNKLHESIFFRAIYEQSNIADEKRRKEDVEENFNSLKLMFSDDNYILNNSELIQKLFNVSREKEEIQSELNFIIEYFRLKTDKTDTVLQQLIIISSKEDYLQKTSDIVFFIEKIGARHLMSDFCNKIEDYQKKLESKSNLKEINMLNNTDVIKSLQLNCQEEKYTMAYKILRIIHQKEALIDFISDLKEEDTREFSNFIDEVDNAFVNQNNLNDLIRVIQFYSEIQKSFKNKHHLINSIVEQCGDQNKFKDIDVYFKNVQENLIELKDLYDKVNRKEEFSKDKVIRIYENSYYEMKMDIRQYQCEVTYLRENKEIKCSLDDVIELRDKSLFFAKKQLTKIEDIKNDSFYGILNSFSSIIDQITRIMNTAQELSLKGYPTVFEIEIEVIKGNVQVKFEDSEDFDNLNDKQFHGILEDLTKLQLDFYSNHHEMSFLFGKQFSNIVDYIRLDKNKIGINYFLKYFTNNQYKIKIASQYSHTEGEKEKCEEMLDSVKDFLIQVLDGNNLNMKKIYSTNMIKGNKYNGLYTLLVNERQYEENVIKWYLHVTSNFPLAHTVLLCNDLTSFEEITAFLYRAILCPDNVLFFLIKADDLPLDKSQEISSLINRLYITKMNKDIKTALVFLYSDKTNPLMSYIMNNSKQLTDKDIQNVAIPQLNNIEVFFSMESGVGKSTQIKKEVLNSNKKYIYFPIGGQFTVENVIERLQREEFIDNETVLHLDLMETEQLVYMKDFLFSLIICKWYYYNENIFYLGSKIDIKIEIPAGFTDFRVKFPILTLFKQKEFLVDSLPPLDVSQNIDSNIQVVCNYLKQSKETIENKNIYIPNISSDLIKSNLITLQPLPADECEQLINQNFKIHNPTYYQKQAFINILGTQLKNLSCSIYTSVDQLKEIGEAKKSNLLSIRSFILQSFIKNTEHFTKGAYSNLKLSQITSHTILQQLQAGFNPEKEKEEAIKQLENKEVVSFDKISPSLVFFNEDKNSLSIISTAKESEQEYKDLMDLYNSKNLDEEKEKLIDFKSLSSKDFFKEVKQVLNLNNPITEIEKLKIQSKYDSIEKIVGSYVFTADNYIKMILILLRIRAHIPVIMMGETGCGKTCLIKMISSLLGNKMMVFNIHAGICNIDIIKFMNEKVEPALKEEKKKQEEVKQGKLKEKDVKLPIWVFLDEINTCNSMGLISEMMCKQTMEGKTISEDIIFIGACNPYRTIKHEKENIGLVQKHKVNVKNLVYNVNPLPHSLLNFVFDFGNLKEEDEVKYISSMISSCINKVFEDNNKEDEKKEDAKAKEDEEDKIDKENEKAKKVSNIAIKAIVASQKYIRDNYDVSSVSLREIRRFSVFYEWFVKILSERNTNKDHNRDKRINRILSFENIQLNSIILSLYLCYYLRLPKKELRSSYIGQIEKIIGTKFIEVADNELTRLIDYIPLQKGIAKNLALKDNLFTLFACVNNKIPVFICGKPGCSKTLSVHLLYQAMKGTVSDSEFFKQLPRIQLTPYQGSSTTTSESIIKLFDKARAIIKGKSNKDMISMIYFDEMGLAEISKNNPLKVIHSELEFDENVDKIAFVGISNWKLDSSKMNRGLFLSVPEPNENDMKETAKTIAQSYDSKLEAYNNFFEQLASAYFKFKESLNKDVNIDFHGSRDFYHLIKLSAKKLLTESNINQHFLNITALEGIQRNFGGRSESMKRIKEKLSIYFPNCKGDDEYDVIDCVEKNLQDYDCRYLLVISNSSISPFLLGLILKKLEKEYCIYIGSKFLEDSNKDYYSIKILNKIQRSMEAGKTIILKNLDFIYPSLYELFNQNFTVVNNKSYARIALGSSNTPMAFVHEKFKSIVLVDEKEVAEQKAPFLNRFEKHIISFDYLLDNDLKELDKEMNKILTSFTTPIDDKTLLGIKLGNHLINCNPQEIQGMIYNLRKNGIEIKLINRTILYEIIPTFSQDLIAFMKYSQFKTQYNELISEITEIYKKDGHQNLTKYLQISKAKTSLIYTFSTIYEKIIFKENFSSDLIGEISNESVQEKMVSTFKSEAELEQFINDFLVSEKRICFLKFDPFGYKHIHHIKFLIENIEKENLKIYGKIFILGVYLSRDINEKDKKETDCFNNPLFLSHLVTDYTQIFIDNLNGEDLLITDLIDKTTDELFHNEMLIKVDELFKDNLLSSISLLNYDCQNGKDEVDHDNIIGIISDYEFIKHQYISSILKYIEKEEDIIKKLFDKANVKVFNSHDSFITELKKYLQGLFLHARDYIVFKIEEDCILTKHYLDNLDNNELNEVFIQYMNNIDLTGLKLSDEFKKNQITILNGLQIPGSKPAFNQLAQYIHTIKEEFNKNEENLRTSYYKDIEFEKVNGLIKEYEAEYDRILFNINVEMDKISLFKFLKEKRNSLSPNFQKNLMADYYLIYISSMRKTRSIDFEEFLELFISIHISQQDSLVKQIAMTATFLESSIPIISILYDIFENLLVYKPNIINLIKELIANKEVIYEKSDRNPEYKERINQSFHIVLEALLAVTLKDTEFLKRNDEEFYKYLNALKIIAQNCSQIEMVMWLTLKELNTLNSFVQVYELYSSNGIDLNQHLPAYFELISKEKELIKDQDIQQLKDNLKSQSQYFNNILGTLPIFPKMFVSFLLNNYKKIPEEDYRKDIIEMILANTQFLLESHKFLYLIFLCHDIEPTIKEIEEQVEEEKEENLKKFLSFKNTKNDILETLNSSTNPILHEMLLYFFERKIYLVMKELKTDESKVFGISLDYLDIAIKYLEGNFLNKNKGDLSQLAFLYCIAYVKVYLSFFVNISHLKFQTIGDMSPITKVISGTDNNNLRRMIKIFVFKLFKQYINTFDEFKVYNWAIHQISWAKEFTFEEDVQSIFNYLFISIDKDAQYYECYNCYINDENESFRGSTNDMINLIGSNGVMMFVDLSINKMISELIKSGYVSSHKYVNFSIYAHDILNNPVLNKYKTMHQFLFLIFDSTIMEKQLLPKMKKELESVEKFEMLMYCYKLCLICLDTEEKSWYKSLFSKDILKIIKQSFVPGGEQTEDRLLSTVNELDNLFVTLNNPNEGIYKCSCNAWYQIAPNGMPTNNSIYKCQNRECNEDIGGANNIIVKRKGHVRIYKNQTFKEQIDKDYLKVGNSEGILFDTLKEEAKNLFAKEPKGIIKTSYSTFLDNNKKTRALDMISYRLLSLLLYSILHYGEIMNYYNQNEIKPLLIDNKTTGEMLEDNWILLHKSLVDRGISRIQIYFNMIFEELGQILSKHKTMDTKDARSQLEKQIGDLTTKSIENYSAYEEKYKKVNTKYLKQNPTSIKSFIYELELPKNIPEEYPYYQYFMLDNFSGVSNAFENQLASIPNSKEKYPIITNCLNQSDTIDKLQNVILINPFVNYMIDRYSYQITRAEAKRKMIEKEINEISIHYDSIKNLFDDFINGYSGVYSTSTQYLSRLKMNPKLISINDSLSYCLPDDSEKDHGIYLAAAYVNFIKWQNDLLNETLNTMSNNKIKPYLKESMQKRIMIQDAKKNDIVTTTINSDNSMFSCLNDLFGYFSIRNCFNKDGSINYYKYKQVDYDLDSIEEELQKIILPGKKMLNDKIKFVIYGYEGCRNNNFSVIQSFIGKYKQIKLNDEEKNLLKACIIRNKGRKEKLLFFIQLLIFYLSEKSNFSADKSINEIIIELPAYVNLSTDCKSIFDKNANLKVNQLIEVFEYIELLCFNSIKENLDIDNKPLSNDFEENITAFFKKGLLKRVDIDNLATAVRRFISRKLSGKRNDQQVKVDENIFDYLNQPEYWPCNIENEIDVLRQEMDVQVCQAVDFYRLIGKKEAEQIEFMEDQFNNEEENKKETKKINEGNKNEAGNKTQQRSKFNITQKKKKLI